MNAESLNEIIQKLSQSRPVFHSEADFQFSLASAIKDTYPTAEIRLERPFPRCTEAGRTIYLDILVILDGKLYPIELKYKTSTLGPDHCVINDELYQLKNQGARDLGVFYCLKDVERLENLAKQPNFGTGFAIWLTNDFHYWTEPRRKDTNYIEFALYDGVEKSHEMNWLDGIMLGKKVCLKNCYKISWQKYSNNLETDTGEKIKRGDFRYVLLTIEK